MKKRPSFLVAIIVYKGFVTLSLLTTSLVLLLALKKHDALVDFSESYLWEGRRVVFEWMLEKIINIQPKTLKLSGVVTGIYGVVTAIETIGLWYSKTWATVLVISLVGVSIVPEIYELMKGVSYLKVTIFLINILLFWYLVKNHNQH